MSKFFSILSLVFAFQMSAVLAQSEPEGVIVYRAPATSSTEAIEFRKFRQDNVLFSTLITPGGERRQLKSGGVIAVVPYPPAIFGPSFEEVAALELDKIGALETSNPQVRAQLESARGKWSRGLEVFRHNRPAATLLPSPRTEGSSYQKLPPSARLTGATADSASVTYDHGVRTLPLAGLSPAEIVTLNATSRSIQLPLGLEKFVATTSAPAAPAISSVTGQVERTGRTATAFCARALGVSDLAFSVWTFFVVFPGLILLLLMGLIFSGRRPPILSRSPSRPL